MLEKFTSTTDAGPSKNPNMLGFHTVTEAVFVLTLLVYKLNTYPAVFQVPDDPAELHQVMFKKKLTSSKDTSTFKKPKRKVDDGSAKRERRRLKRQMKRQKTAR